MKIQKIKVKAIAAGIILALNIITAPLCFANREFPGYDYVLQDDEGMPVIYLSKIYPGSNKLEILIEKSELDDSAIQEVGIGYTYKNTVNVWDQRELVSEDDNIKRFLVPAGINVIEAEHYYFFYTVTFNNGEKWVNSIDYGDCGRYWREGRACKAAGFIPGFMTENIVYVFYKMENESFESESALESGSEPEPKPEPESEPEPEPEPEQESIPDSESTPESEQPFEPEPVPEPELAPESGAGASPELESESQSEPELDPESTPKASGTELNPEPDVPEIESASEQPDNTIEVERETELNSENEPELIPKENTNEENFEEIEFDQGVEELGNDVGLDGTLLSPISTSVTAITGSNDNAEWVENTEYIDDNFEVFEGSGDTTLDVPILGVPHSEIKGVLNWILFFGVGNVTGAISTWFLLFILKRRREGRKYI